MKIKKENKTDEISKIIDKKQIRFIYPFVTNEKKSEMEIGGSYAKIIMFAEYPNEPRGNWLADLKKLKGNITITEHLAATNNAAMIEYYNDTIKNKKAELDRTIDPKTKSILGKELKSAEIQLEEALSNRSGFLNVYTYVLIQASNLKELKRLEEKVMMSLAKMKVKGLVPHYLMQDGYVSSMPIFENRLSEFTYQMSNTTAASSMLLADDNEICDLTPGAEIVGLNDKNNSIISVNYENTKVSLNRNMIVFGASGTGKTTFIENLILNKIAKGERIFILDPENEYTKIVRKYGGNVVELSSISNYRINPLQFFSDQIIYDGLEKESMNEQEKMSFLIKQKCSTLKGFFQMLKNDITQVEQSIIEKELATVYKKIEKKNFSELKNEDFPILEDLLHVLEKLKTNEPDRFKIIQDFYYILEIQTNSLFNGSTNIDISNQILSFNLKGLQNEKGIQSACYINIFSFLWDEITRNFHYSMKTGKKCPVTLIADEFHFLLLNEESADFYFQAYKRFRKYNAGCISGTQQVLDVLNAKMKDNNMDVGTAITENSFTKVFFGFDNKGVNDVVNKLDIKFSNTELKLLKAKKQGKAIFIYGTKRALLRVRLNQEELRLCNPERYQETYKLDPNVQPNYRAELYISSVEKEEIRGMI